MKAKVFLEDFGKQGWDMPNLYERLYEFIDQPDEVFAFCVDFALRSVKSATFFQDALSFLTENDLKKLVDFAFENMDKVELEIIEEICSHTALQFPHFLHPYLEIIFEKKINRSAFYCGYPWRNLPEKDIPFFIQKLQLSTDIEEQKDWVLCLLETRHLPTLYFLKDFVSETKCFNYDFHYLLEGVGFTLRNGEIVSYTSSELYHFSFEKKYFVPKNVIYLDAKKHPTWNAPCDIQKHKMGGVLEPDEVNPFFHLLTLNCIPKGIKIGLEKITFGVHLRELNEYWETLFYQHDTHGIPHRIGEKQTKIEMCDEEAIAPTEVAFSLTPKRWQSQTWGHSNGRENLFRLGGEPTWVQSAEVPICPICGEKMDFLFQLDSDLPSVNGNEIWFGSGGILYAFWCDKSKVSAFIMQCT